jgi:hypothetical protein
MIKTPELCLSVRQPWAWLIVNGYKDVENRTWPTKVRGRILIHASKTMTDDDYRDCCLFIMERGISDVLIMKPEYLKRGGIIGETTITDCVSSHQSKWFEGPYGFTLENSKPLPFYQCQGKLGFFSGVKL